MEQYKYLLIYTLRH